MILAFALVLGMLPAVTFGVNAGATNVVGKVEAVASGYGYTTSFNAYAPTFTTLAAYDTNGNKINLSDFVWSTAFYKKASFSPSEKLTSAPVEGETYYFAVYFDGYIDGVNYDYDSVGAIKDNSIVTVPGFEIEFYSFMEREMSSFYEITYKATRSYKRVGGVTAIGTGVAYNSELGTYAPTFAALYSTTENGVKINPNSVTGDYSVEFSGFYESYSNNGTVFGDKVTSYPAEGETVYGYLWLDNPQGNYGLVDELINITIPGYTVEIISAFERDMGFNVAVVYKATRKYKQVAGVNAAAWEVEYDSTLGGYAPVFYTLYSLDTEGNKLYPGSNGDYSVVVGCFYDSYAGGTFGNKVTSEPAVGDTVYGYLLLDNPQGNLGIIDELVTIDISDYEVELIGAYEQDMGFNVAVIYSATRIAAGSEVYVAGVGMSDGDYLAVDATAVTTTKPSGGYAYYKDGTLTLNNYSYKGGGYYYDYEYTIIYSCNDLTINLVGSNTLEQTHGSSNAVWVEGASLTIGGDGTLVSTDDCYGLYAEVDVTVNGGTIQSTGYYNGIRSWDGDVIINGGNLTFFGRYPITAYYGSVIINGGAVTAVGNESDGGYAVWADEEFVVASTLKIHASTTVDGALGTYDPAEHSSYKKIVIGQMLPMGKTLVKIDGVWHYVVDGQLSNETTLVKYKGEYYYVKDGIKCNDNTLVKYYNKWYHVNGGKLVRDTTLVKYKGVWYYVKNGVKCTDNTLVKFNGAWYHVNGGKLVRDTTLVKYNNVWYYVKNGVKCTDNTLVKFNGAWYHVNGGKLVRDTTLVKYSGKWYYVENGKVDFTYTGKVLYKGIWYNVKKGVKI